MLVKQNKDLSKSEIKELKIKRYEKAMFEIPQKDFVSEIKKYQSEFNIFLEGNIDDTNALLQLSSFFTDPYLRELWDTTKVVYKDLSVQESELKHSFSYLKHYFPEIKTPEVYTYISGFDINFPCYDAI